ncbi:MAG: glutamate--tRNA ligase, partial [Bacteroidales bacterium]
MSNELVRVRFAPSPTGPLHIGGLRTALFNYLFAKKYKGAFILRIEDTDQTRYVKGAEEYIIESLKWCGIEPDEGVNKGGKYAPYRQSERKDLYFKHAESLVLSGYAYYAFDTPEELEKLRTEHESRKETFTYDASVRNHLNNSLNLADSEVEKKLKNGDPYVIRFKFNDEQEIVMHDEIRGKVKVLTSTLDDKVLYKSDGMPTYHLANVVDDYLMKITHVIRGEEWLPSLPLHFSLYRALGWEDDMPRFAHLPLILKPNGKGKLSKRDGDKGGFPVFPLEWKDPASGEISAGYRESGYFPEACLNILALLGWNSGSDKEIFSLDELIQAFDIDRVGKAGAKFDPEKARWFNHQYMQMKDLNEISKEFGKLLEEKNIRADEEKINKVVELVRERADFIFLYPRLSFYQI